MSFQLTKSQVIIHLKDAQVYLREAYDLCTAKIWPEWETIEKDVKEAEELVTKIIKKALETD